MKKVMSLILAVLFAASAIACSGDTDTTSETTAQAQNGDDPAEETTAETEPPIVSGVPDDLNLNGESVSLWYTTVASSVAETFVDFDPEQTGDILDDATYALNVAVEEKLNVKLDFFNSEVPTSNSATEIRKLLLAGDDTYDMYNGVQWVCRELVVEGLYLNVKDAPYISFDEPWWDSDYMEESVIGDTLFALVGDYSVDRTRCLSSLYFNKNMFVDFFDDANKLYQTVIDGDWTYEALREYCAKVYSDLNNSGSIDRDDRMGMFVNSYNNIDNFFFGTGVRVTERDSKGYPELVINNERTANIVSSLYQLVFETDGVLETGNKYEDDVLNRDGFTQDKVLFLPGFFYTAEAMRDMQSDYGILPYPKLDDNQDEYSSIVQDIVRLMFLPSNCADPDAVCAVLEEMAFLGYRDVLPEYYNVLMKNKYARDDISAMTIDLIRDSLMTDIGMIYNFNGINNIMRRLIQGKSDNFASKYAEMEPAALVKIEEHIDKFEAIK